MADTPIESTECSPHIDIATAREFRLVNRDKTNNFIWGELNQGVLTFIVANQPKNGTGCSGKWMFDAMMNHFSGSVAAIQGSWTYGDNLAIVNRFTGGRRMTIDAAAAKTWTGKRAAEWGYTEVEVLHSTGSAGSYTNIQILFKSQ